MFVVVVELVGGVRAKPPGDVRVKIVIEILH